MSKKDGSQRDIKKEHKRGKLLPALCRISGIILVILVLAFAAALVVPQLFGYEAYNIMSGSMEPEITTGSIIYVKYAEPSEIKEGEIIVFDRSIQEDEELLPTEFVVAHRVVENRSIEGQFVTKGDANDTEDMLTVPYSAVRGTVAVDIPMLGEFMAIYTTLPGKICLLGIALCGVLLNILATRLKYGTGYANGDDN